MAEGEESSKMDTSADSENQEKHDNWFIVGEIILSICEPISVYVDNVMKAFYEKLCGDLGAIGECKSPESCNTKTTVNDLCKSCERWLVELKKFHKKGHNPWWWKNCNSAGWSKDHWEVTKFFMSFLGDYRKTVKDAKSTDLSSLLNVLQHLKDEAFPGKIRVNVDLVKNLCSQVRNRWAHAPRQEITDDEKDGCFSIAEEFLEDLNKIFPHPEIENCMKFLQTLHDHGTTNEDAIKIRCLSSQQRLLDKEIIKMKYECSLQQLNIEEQKQKLEDLKCLLNECLQKIRNIEHRQIEQRCPISCLPDKLLTFTARKNETEKVVSFVMDKESAVVSIHGGPGFGKTTIAVEVSHQLSEDHSIPVIFCYLTAATTVDEVVRKLCLNAGIKHEGDAKTSFFFWLKNIKSKVVFVMDNIDDLLEEKENFDQFVRELRQLSDHHCQIITTSRMRYEISGPLTRKVQVNEMDNESCIALLQKACPIHKNDGKFLQEVAKACGKIPLAMCIVGALNDDYENPDELLQDLRNQPMASLKDLYGEQIVKGAIEMSYRRLNHGEKKCLNNLAVFDGSFDFTAATAVINQEILSVRSILKKLACRHLIEQHAKERYSIHILIKSFLIDQLSENDKKSAQTLMVKHYLKVGHDLTMQSYCKDGYKVNREALGKEGRHIQNVLNVCCKQNDHSSKIIDCLIQSEIYTTSAKLFSIFVRTIIPGSIVDKFLQLCAQVALERKDYAIKINFDCLLASQKPDIVNNRDEYNKKMEKIKEDFQTHRKDLTTNKSVCAHYHYQYARYLMHRSQTCERQEKKQLLEEAIRQQKQSLGISISHTDKIFSFLQLGAIRKKQVSDEHSRQRENSQKSIKKEQKCYEKAIELSLRHLGEHELTATCYKYLGDHFLLIRENEEAKKMYAIAKTMRESLGVEGSEKHIYLLNNLGKCLTYLDRYDKSIELLKIAYNTAKKLADSDKIDHRKAKVCTSLAIAYEKKKWLSEEALKYAKEALKFKKLDSIIVIREFKQLQQIVSREQN